MLQKLPVDDSGWRKELFSFNEESIQKNDEDSDKGYILEVYVDYSKQLQK